MEDDPGSIDQILRKTILVVEEEPDKLCHYEELLSRHYAVLSAKTGADAISLLKKHRAIELILLDCRLLDLSGLEVLKEFRYARPSVPAIIVMAYGSEDVAAGSLRCEVADYAQKPSVYRELAESITRCLGAEASFAKPVVSADVGMRKSRVIHPINFQRALQFIDDNYTLHISLSQVADKACLSYHHFSKVFKKTFGIGFRTHINGKRIDRARELLATTDRTVSDIACLVGFDDVTNFERVFKKLTALTPSEYRRGMFRSSTEGNTKKAEVNR